MPRNHLAPRQSAWCVTWRHSSNILIFRMAHGRLEFLFPSPAVRFSIYPLVMPFLRWFRYIFSWGAVVGGRELPHYIEVSPFFLRSFSCFRAFAERCGGIPGANLTEQTASAHSFLASNFPCSNCNNVCGPAHGYLDFAAGCAVGLDHGLSSGRGHPTPRGGRSPAPQRAEVQPSAISHPVS